ncbi:hypothetical protein QF002_004638 [Paraburkholderia youngii]
MATQNPPSTWSAAARVASVRCFVTLALVDHLRRTDVNVVLLETDTSNPDVMKAVHGRADGTGS